MNHEELFDATIEICAFCDVREIKFEIYKKDIQIEIATNSSAIIEFMGVV
jgi:hypothetical protein